MSETDPTDAGKESGKKGSPLLDDWRKTIMLSNGRKLVLSVVEMKELGMWHCDEKKHYRCKCKKLQKYGVAETRSEYYLKPKSKRIVFE